MFALVRLLPISTRLDLFMFSTQRDMRYIRPAAALARILGIPVTLHDYRYRPATAPKSIRRLYSLCDCVEVGDEGESERPDGFRWGLGCRAVVDDRISSDVTPKSSAVPVVAVCGDFESGRTVSLARRAHDLIKQKYPRTAFLLISPVDGIETVDADDNTSDSFRLVMPANRDDVRALYEQADILMILSPGGLNRDWLVGARAAGYPVIVNGSLVSEAAEGVIVVPRDSYTRLAEAVIRLVDDDEYYRGFARRRA
jgi:hypothetical protein